MSMVWGSDERGFTFFEVLIVMGILVIVGGFALFVSMETYRGSNFRSDRNLLVATLQRARAEAMNNICTGTCTDGEPHGVHVQSDAYIIFQGSSYNANDSNNAPFDSNTIVTKTPSSLDVVFSQLSGTTTPVMITLSDSAGHVSTTTISSGGQITWTN